MSNYRASLKQILSTGGTLDYPLPTQEATIIGREPSCQIVLDSSSYLGVSRRHLEIRPLMSQSPEGMPQWQVCDLGSSNGTYINGNRLEGCQTLRSGDRLTLGQNKVEFIFEYQEVLARTPLGNNTYQTPTESLTLSQLLPIVSSKGDLFQKGYIIPGAIAVTIVVGMFAALGKPQIFNALLAILLIGGAYFFIYQLAGKKKPWWLIVLSALFTIIFLLTPLLNIFILVFRQILPGEIPNTDNIGFIQLFIAMLFGAGLMEELIKAIPIFVAMWIGRRLQSPWREKIGVWEPLDGILLGTASAAGFTLLETLGQYVPNTIAQIAQQQGIGVGELVGLQLLIPRIIGSVAGHMAYSGYFGYFIGLSVLKPSKRWKILGIGYLSSSVLHALWNASGAISHVITVIAGVLAYAFLMAAIIKARQISPSRAENFATQIRRP